MKNKNLKDEKYFTKKWFYIAVISGAVFALITTFIAIFRNVNSKQQTKKIIQNNYIPTETIRKDIEKNKQNENQSSSSSSSSTIVENLKESYAPKETKDISFNKTKESSTKSTASEKKENLNKKTEKNKKQKSDENALEASANIETVPKKTSQKKTNLKDKLLKKEKTDNPETKKENIKKLNFKQPLDGKIIRDYSNNNPVKWNITNDWRTHDGIDIEAEKDTPVKATLDGVVEEVYAQKEQNKPNSTWGGIVKLAHKNGLKSLYKGLDVNNIKVKQGQEVKQGEVLGLLGNTKDKFHQEQDEKNHLHFETFIEYDKNSNDGKNDYYMDYNKKEKEQMWLSPEELLIKR